MNPAYRSSSKDWPELDFRQGSDTIASLHLWTQIVGKIRLLLTPWTNHSWHVPLYITARGMRTSPVPYREKSFEIFFDFIGHRLVIETTDGSQAQLLLEARSVADFYHEVMASLKTVGIDISIYTLPSEIPDAIPFEQDTVHQAYDPDYANRFWRALVQVDRVFKTFRARFIGKCSPVHFFWGSFDLAVTRFSGREAPPHPGGVPNFPDWVAREAYSHEVSSAGFWPGGSGVDYAAFYAYAYPAPEGFSEYTIQPDGAAWSSELGEFLLPYDEVRRADSPDEVLLDFLQSTYVAAADLGSWDRAALERDLGKP